MTGNKHIHKHEDGSVTSAPVGCFPSYKPFYFKERQDYWCRMNKFCLHLFLVWQLTKLPWIWRSGTPHQDEKNTCKKACHISIWDWSDVMKRKSETSLISRSLKNVKNGDKYVFTLNEIYPPTVSHIKISTQKPLSFLLNPVFPGRFSFSHRDNDASNKIEMARKTS